MVIKALVTLLSISSFAFAMSGGVAVKPNDPLIQHFVGLYIDRLDSPQSGICTGTIIGPRTILTSAHCLSGDPKKLTLYISFSNEPYRILKQAFETGKTELYLKAKSFEIYPKYKLALTMRDQAASDVAVIHLEETSKLPSSHGPLPLIAPYSLYQLPDGIQVYATGSPGPQNAGLLEYFFKKDNFPIVKNLGPVFRSLFGTENVRLAGGELDNITLLSNPFFLAQSSRSQLLDGDSGSAALANSYGVPKVFGVLRGEYFLDEKSVGWFFTSLYEPSLNLWVRSQTR